MTDGQQDRVPLALPMGRSHADPASPSNRTGGNDHVKWPDRELAELTHPQPIGLDLRSGR